MQDAQDNKQDHHGDKVRNVNAFFVLFAQLSKCVPSYRFLLLRQYLSHSSKAVLVIIMVGHISCVFVNINNVNIHVAHADMIYH